jgi:epoxide hydrolase 4
MHSFVIIRFGRISEQVSEGRNEMPDNFESTFKHTNGIHLHVMEAGADGAPLVLFLHGFPEFWWSWKKQMGPVMEEGYYVMTPD